MSVTVVVLVFAGLVLLRVVLVGVGAMAIIRPVRACPACFHDTVSVRKPLLPRIAPAFEWRWCPSCGWEALARRASRGAWPPPRPPAPPHRVGEAWTPDAAGDHGSPPPG